MDMKQVINELYDIEGEIHHQEAMRKMLSIAVDADHASMLRAICDRFGQSVSSFAGQILEDAIKQAFLHLDDSDKRTLAEKADKETSEYLEKKGIKQYGTDFTGEFTGSNHWRSIVAMWDRNSSADEDSQA